MFLIERAKRLAHRAISRVMKPVTRVRYRKLVRYYESLPKMHQESCWCGDVLDPLVVNPSWAFCRQCGTFVNLYPPNPLFCQEIYSLKPYWRGRANLHGTPDIAKRGHLYLSDGRLAYWLSVIGQYGPVKGRVIEVGCAPGILLQCLYEQGYECLGVEVAQDTAEWVGHHTGVKVLTGVFPHVNLPPCDVFLALDVLEHSYDPLGFMKGVHDVLNPGGKAIIQSPIPPSDQNYDIKELCNGDFKRMFNDLHVFIFNTNAIHQLAELSDLIVLNDRLRWRVGHEIVVLGRECTTLPCRTALKEKAMAGMRRLP